jgi:type I restriction enzyme S subunit
VIAHPLVKLGSLTKIRTGKLDANASSENGEYPFFTCARKPLRISSYTYDCECILVAGNGDLNVKHYKGKFDAYQRTYIIEAADSSNDELHLRYLYHFMECYLETLREQSIGGIIKYIKLGNLTDAEVPLPPLSEQKRIAGILDAADRLRAKRRAALAQLDTLLQSTFLDLFGDPVTNPKGWEVVNSSHLFSVPPRIGTTTPANGSGHIVVRVGEVGSSIIKFEKCGRVEISEKDFNKYKLEVGDTVIARAIGSKNQLGKASLIGVSRTRRHRLPCHANTSRSIKVRSHMVVFTTIF